MSRKQRKYEGMSENEIKEAYKKSKDTSEQKRLMCIKLRVEKGLGSKEIAEITEYSDSHVRRIISKYGRAGIQGLTKKVQAGNRRNLSKEEERGILEPFEKMARAGKVLEVKEIRKSYEAAVGREVSASTIYRMLARQEWRKIMPRPKHPKSKPDEIEAYKKTE